MTADVFSDVMLADSIGGWEVVLILAIVLILFGARQLPDLARRLGGEETTRGFWQGIREFLQATRDVADEVADKDQRVSGVVYEAIAPDS